MPSCHELQPQPPRSDERGAGFRPSSDAALAPVVQAPVAQAPVAQALAAQALALRHPAVTAVAVEGRAAAVTAAAATLIAGSESALLVEELGSVRKRECCRPGRPGRRDQPGRAVKTSRLQVVARGSGCYSHTGQVDTKSLNR